MRDFILNTLPFAAIAVCAGILAVSIIKQGERPGKRFMAEGMAIGMCLGVALAAALHGQLAIGASLGLLFGEMTGLFIRKKESK